MKKTIAALGASVLGLGSAVVVGAAPATAAPIPPDCTDIAEQLGVATTTPDPEAMWFENCIPQYGMGKVEFTIVADEDNPAAEFPEGFVTLDNAQDPESGITVTSSGDTTAFEAYFQAAEAPGTISPISPMELFDETATSQTYGANVFAPIETIDWVEPAAVPEAIVSICEFEEELNYGAWVASYGAVDTTFSQTVAGKQWDYTITGQALDSYFLITDDGWLCMTDGETEISGPFETGGFIYLGLVVPFLGESFFGPTSFQSPADLQQLLEGSEIAPAALGESGLWDLGVFGPNTAAAPPALAATGSDGNSLILPAIIVGGVVILGGALVAVSIIRKRRKDAPATPQDTPDTTV